MEIENCDVEGYEVIEELSSSSLCKVFLVRSTPINLLKVIKIYSSGLEAHAQHEVRINSLIDHACIPSVYEYGYNRNGNFYIVFEVASGIVLSEEKIIEGIKVDQVFNIVAHLTEIVDYLNTINVIHSDLKLDNLIISGGFDVSLIDFNSSVTLNEISNGKMTLANASSEQLYGFPLTDRTNHEQIAFIFFDLVTRNKYSKSLFANNRLSDYSVLVSAIKKGLKGQGVATHYLASSISELIFNLKKGKYVSLISFREDLFLVASLEFRPRNSVITSFASKLLFKLCIEVKRKIFFYVPAIFIVLGLIVSAFETLYMAKKYLAVESIIEAVGSEND